MDIELLTEFAGFLTEKVTDTNRPIIADFLERFLVVEIKKLEDVESSELIPEESIVKEPSKTGNGHKILKKRDLTGDEKSRIRAWFTEVNGQIENDACVALKRGMDEDVAIFQVTGFVTYLHQSIAAGRWTVSDVPAYLTFLRTHRNLWATYDSPKYRAMRRKLGIVDEPDPSSTKDVSASAEELITPSFAMGYKKTA